MPVNTVPLATAEKGGAQGPRPPSPGSRRLAHQVDGVFSCKCHPDYTGLNCDQHVTQHSSSEQSAPVVLIAVVTTLAAREDTRIVTEAKPSQELALVGGEQQTTELKAVWKPLRNRISLGELPSVSRLAAVA